jgi:CheY-like chemotaxis protein
MPEQPNAQADAWNILLVEDEETIRQQLVDYFSNVSFDSRGLNVNEIGDLSKALNLIRERKADLIVLDVYRGKALRGGEQAGIQILDNIKRSGFVPVVLYTALPEGLEAHRSTFVRLVGKEAGGLEKLSEEIADLFRLRIPQIHRAIVNHMDQTMRGYMWGFVQEHWTDLEPLVNKPEFLRLVVQRLATTFAREGIDRMTKEVYGIPATGQTASGDTVHPAEYYIKPPLGQDPMLGDIRLRQTGGNSGYLVVLWPTCDMVSSGGRTPKTEFVLCALASLAKDVAEVAEWVASSSSTKQKKVERLVKNTREESPDRFHFLPGVWDIPDLVVDFQKLEHVALDDVKPLSCLATLASPFAEALGARFQRYISRIGTPDLDINVVVELLKNRAASTTGGEATTH